MFMGEQGRGKKTTGKIEFWTDLSSLNMTKSFIDESKKNVLSDLQALGLFFFYDTAPSLAGLYIFFPVWLKKTVQSSFVRTSVISILLWQRYCYHNTRCTTFFKSAYDQLTVWLHLILSNDMYTTLGLVSYVGLYFLLTHIEMHKDWCPCTAEGHILTNAAWTKSRMDLLGHLLVFLQ